MELLFLSHEQDKILLKNEDSIVAFFSFFPYLADAPLVFRRRSRGSRHVGLRQHHFLVHRASQVPVFVVGARSPGLLGRFEVRGAALGVVPNIVQMKGKRKKKLS